MTTTTDPNGGNNTMSARGITDIQSCAAAQSGAEINQSVLEPIQAVPLSNSTGSGAALSVIPSYEKEIGMLDADVYGHPEEEERKKLLEEIQAVRINPNDPIEEDEFIFRWGGVEFAPRHNMVSIKAHSKAGKTFILTAICTAFLTGNNGGLECCAASNERLLFVDTEQSDNDTRKILRRLIKESPDAAERAIVINVRTKDTQQRMELIEKCVEVYKPTLIIVDGIADLITGMQYNEMTLADEAITRLNRIAEQYNAVVFTAIHVNKNDDAATGWLGRLLQQKCAVELMVEKDKDGQRLLKPTAVRHKEFPSISFDIEDTPDKLGKARIISLQDAHDIANKKDRENYRSKLESWGIVPPLTLKKESFTTLIREKRTAAEGETCKSSTASTFVSRCIGCGLFKLESGFVTFES